MTRHLSAMVKADKSVVTVIGSWGQRNVGTEACFICIFIALLTFGCGRRSDRAGRPHIASSHRPSSSRTVSESHLFERITNTKARIDFIHRWAPDVKHRHVIAGAMCAGGVAIGDVNGDARPDIYLTRPHGGSKLYRNEGNFQFVDVTTSSGLQESAWGSRS